MSVWLGGGWKQIVTLTRGERERVVVPLMHSNSILNFKLINVLQSVQSRVYTII